MLKESYVAKLKTLPKDAIKIRVGYPSIFSPSEALLSEFNEIKNNLMKKGMSELEARKKAWKQTDFENRYREEIGSKPGVANKLKEIMRLSENKDVYLYCYCGKYPCHHFILMDIVEKMRTKTKIINLYMK
ncbi:hypothetical protein B6U70_01875 [Euryarchaeota archaeon ex4484_162]|nr:MAG: hypothetical protein B6U70_01875 [Euryarchaeota archaeon ex4484_162]RLF28080.1 MAG: hypothetical protein DRN05_04755 [Thermoplasmata archaeon]